MNLRRKKKAPADVEIPPHSWAAVEIERDCAISLVDVDYTGAFASASRLRDSEREASSDADSQARKNVGKTYAVVKITRIVSGVAAVTTREIP